MKMSLEIFCSIGFCELLLLRAVFPMSLIVLGTALTVLFCVSGASQLTSPPSQTDSLLALFDPLSSNEGEL